MLKPFAARVLELADAEADAGVVEHGSNRGPEIDQYWRDIGRIPGGLDLPPAGKAKPWCCVFVCSCVKRAADETGVPVPIHLTAGVFTLDEKAPSHMRTGHPVPGCIGILKGHKHVVLIKWVDEHETCGTVEGNTNPGGSAEGDGVYRRTRTRDEFLCFIDLNLAPE